MNKQPLATQTDPLLTPEREPKKFTLKGWIDHVNTHVESAKMEETYTQARKRINDRLGIFSMKPSEIQGKQVIDFNATYGTLTLKFGGGQFLHVSAQDEGELEIGYPPTIEDAIKIGDLVPDDMLEDYKKAKAALQEANDKRTMQLELKRAVELLGDARVKEILESTPIKKWKGAVL